MNIKRDLTQLHQTFDMVVIGGGITGIAIAREAAERGLSVCLLEKNDFGCATSASTSKLLHGGLRYLESYEFRLVRESLHERRILGCAAGHLIRPLEFIIPIYKGRYPNRWLMQAGMLTYDALSFDRNKDVPEDKKVTASRWVKKDELLNMEPTLDTDGLQGGFVYYDYLSLFPERLSLSFLKTAVEKGAHVYNHAKVIAFDLEEAGGNKKIRSVSVQDTVSNKKFNVLGKVFINATGPWMDKTLGLAEEEPEAKLSRSKGIHLLANKIIGDRAVFYRTGSGRHFFIVPWHGRSLIGPTDTAFEDHPDQLRPTQSDIEQLHADTNETIPGSPLSPEMIQHVPIGIRPLIFSGKSTYKASRKSEIYDHRKKGIEGFISVAGGKWTTSRKLGEDIVEMALKKPELADVNALAIDSSKLPLYGSPGFANPADVYIDFALKEYQTPGVSTEVHKHLIEMYGTEHVDVLKLVRKDKKLAQRLSNDPQILDIQAQVVFAVENESALTLEDICNRRLSIGSFGYPGDSAVEKIASLAAKTLKWSAARKANEMNAYRKTFPLDILAKIGKSNLPAAVKRSAGKKTAKKAARKSAEKQSSASAKKPAAKRTSVKKAAVKKSSAKKAGKTSSGRAAKKSAK